MDFLHLIVEKFGKDLSPGRMFESVVLLSIIWSKLKPHLSQIESRLLGVEVAVKHGFESDDKRFIRVEDRIEKIENKLNMERVSQ